MDMLELAVRDQIEALDAKVEGMMRKIEELAYREAETRKVATRVDQRLKNHEARLFVLERPLRR